MKRREFLAAAAGAPAILRAAQKGIGIDRISILTDEAARTQADAIAFAKQYGLKWVELRNVPGGGPEYYRLPEDQIRAAKKELDDAGLKVSFLNTGMLKFWMPGTELARKRQEAPEQKAQREERDQKRFDTRLEALQSAIRAAHILSVDQVRVFSFSRVPDPPSVFPKIAEILKEMAAISNKDGVRLLIENEASQNVATDSEMAAIAELVPVPGFGLNWDPVNGIHGGEKDQFPGGYSKLPMKRVGNVQMKAEGLILGEQILDWAAIFAALDKDGYKGKVGLETHVFDGTLIEKAHASMAKIRDLTRTT